MPKSIPGSSTSLKQETGLNQFFVQVEVAADDGWASFFRNCFVASTFISFRHRSRCRVISPKKHFADWHIADVVILPKVSWPKVHKSKMVRPLKLANHSLVDCPLAHFDDKVSTSFVGLKQSDKSQSTKRRSVKWRGASIAEESKNSTFFVLKYFGHKNSTIGV